MLNNWYVSLTLKEDYLKILEGLCNELIQEFDKPESERDHFLFDAKDLTGFDEPGFLRKSREEKAKMKQDAFIDLIYSYDFKSFVSFFFGNLDIRKKSKDTVYKWDGWLDDYSYSDYEYCAEDDFKTLLELICVPGETFIEKQVFEEDGLPVRLVLIPLEGEQLAWKAIYPELVWPDEY